MDTTSNQAAYTSAEHTFQSADKTSVSSIDRASRIFVSTLRANGEGRLVKGNKLNARRGLMSFFCCPASVAPPFQDAFVSAQ